MAFRKKEGVLLTHVMHILTDTNIGGAGRLLLTLCKHADRKEFSLMVLLPSHSLLIPLFRENGIRVLETKGGHDRSFSPEDVWELLGIIRREKPHVVHTHASLSGRIAATLAGVSSRIYTRHCAFPPTPAQMRFPLKHFTSLMSTLLSTAVIAVANAAKDDLLKTGVPEKKITVIRNGVEAFREVSHEETIALRASLGIPQDAIVIGMVARMEPYKGHAELLAVGNEL